MKKEKVLSVENLHVQLGQRMINEDISLDVYKGDCGYYWSKWRW